MLQPPPLQLVHRAFGEFMVDAATIQPSPDTFDFILESCAFLAEVYLTRVSDNSSSTSVLSSTLASLSIVSS